MTASETSNVERKVLTLGDGSPALAAMLASKPCVAVALTQEHADGVKSHLAEGENKTNNILLRRERRRGGSRVPAAA